MFWCKRIRTISACAHVNVGSQVSSGYDRDQFLLQAGYDSGSSVLIDTAVLVDPAVLIDTAAGKFVHQGLRRDRIQNRRWGRSRPRFFRSQITGGYEHLCNRSVEDLTCRPHRVLRGRALGRKPSTQFGRSNLQRTRSFLDVAERAKFQLMLDPCGETTHSGHIA